MPRLLASDFDFPLPPDLIARRPAAERDGSRLMLVGRQGNSHHAFHDIGDLLEAYLGPRPLLVLNNTRVIPARVFARKRHGDASEPGGRVELLLVDPLPLPLETAASGWSERWRCLYRSSKPLRPGAALQLEGAAAAALPSAVTETNEGGGRVIIRFHGDQAGGLLSALAQPGLGHVPLPPYIVAARRQAPDERFDEDEDRRRYQTVYAEVPGSVAAPTAGLHFTEALLAALRARGIDQVSVTLHVGPGTFAPLSSDDPAAHVLHRERYDIPAATAEQIGIARHQGRKILAVGTTVVRTLETATAPGEQAPAPGQGESGLFIYPPYRFRAVDALLTNFHLPRSSLLMLVAALAGRERLLAAYREAVEHGYHFYSYGDAMLIPSAMPDNNEEIAS